MSKYDLPANLNREHLVEAANAYAGALNNHARLSDECTELERRLKISREGLHRATITVRDTTIRLNQIQESLTVTET